MACPGPNRPSLTGGRSRRRSVKRTTRKGRKSVRRSKRVSRRGRSTRRRRN